MATQKKAKAKQPRRRKASPVAIVRRARRKVSSSAMKLDAKTIFTMVVGGILAILMTPQIAKSFPRFSKYSGPLMAGIGILLAIKTKGTLRVAGAGLAVGGGVLGYQAYSQNSGSVINGPARMLPMSINGPAQMLPRLPVNGPARMMNSRSSKTSNSSYTPGDFSASPIL